MKTIIAELEDSNYTMQVTSHSKGTYFVRVKITVDDGPLECDIPIAAEIQRCARGESITPFRVKLLDNLTLWLGAVDGRLRLALDGQPQTAPTNAVSGDVRGAVGTGDYYRSAAMTISQPLIVAMVDNDARLEPTCQHNRAARRRN